VSIPILFPFYRKVSSDSGDDLKFYIDSQYQTGISGEVDWQKKSYSLSAGIHILLVARPSRPCVAGASRPRSAGQRPARLKGKMPSPRQDFVQLVAELWTGPSPDSARGWLAPQKPASASDYY
jgi:hypothetical protein